MWLHGLVRLIRFEVAQCAESSIAVCPFGKSPCCELLKLDERATGNGLGTMLYNLTTHSKAERKAQPAEGTPASPTTTVEALEAEEVGAKGVAPAEEKSTEHGAAQMPVSSTAAATALETALGAGTKDQETEDEVGAKGVALAEDESTAQGTAEMPVTSTAVTALETAFGAGAKDRETEKAVESAAEAVGAESFAAKDIGPTAESAAAAGEGSFAADDVRSTAESAAAAAGEESFAAGDVGPTVESAAAAAGKEKIAAGGVRPTVESTPLSNGHYNPRSILAFAYYISPHVHQAALPLLPIGLSSALPLDHAPFCHRRSWTPASLPLPPKKQCR